MKCFTFNEIHLTVIIYINSSIAQSKYIMNELKSNYTI